MPVPICMHPRCIIVCDACLLVPMECVTDQCDALKQRPMQARGGDKEACIREEAATVKAASVLAVSTNSSSSSRGDRLPAAHIRSIPPSAPTRLDDDAGEMREIEQAAKAAAGEGSRTAAAVGEGAAKGLPQEGPLHLSPGVPPGSPVDVAATLMKGQQQRQQQPLAAEQLVQRKGGQLPGEDEEQDHGVEDDIDEDVKEPQLSEPRVAVQAAGEVP